MGLLCLSFLFEREGGETWMLSACGNTSCTDRGENSPGFVSELGQPGTDSLGTTRGSHTQLRSQAG